MAMGDSNGDSRTLNREGINDLDCVWRDDEIRVRLEMPFLLHDLRMLNRELIDFTVAKGRDCQGFFGCVLGTTGFSWECLVYW